MNKKKSFLLSVACVLIACSMSGCSFQDNSDIVSYNISKEADNFNIYRKVKVINNQSDTVMLEFEGWCSIYKDNADNQLELTYRVGEDTYYKDFIGLNDRTTYVITQLDGSKVDKYHYEWLYHSEGDLIPIEINDADKKNNDDTERNEDSQISDSIDDSENAEDN